MIHVSHDRSVCILTLSRPEKKNAFTAAMYIALSEQLIAAEADDAVRVVVITGAGNAFSAGNDLEDFLKSPPQDIDAPPFHFLRTLAKITKPVIAAVNGLAVGVGSTMLFHCELAYAHESARFMFPFVSLGLVPEGASSLLLPQLIGHRRAAEILLLGQPLSAQEAQSIGLVNAVTGESALDLALEKAHQLAQQPRGAVRATKVLLKPLHETLAQIDQEAIAFIERTRSSAAQEAFKAFLEKRKPDFSDLD